MCVHIHVWSVLWYISCHADMFLSKRCGGFEPHGVPDLVARALYASTYMYVCMWSVLAQVPNK